MKRLGLVVAVLLIAACSSSGSRSGREPGELISARAALEQAAGTKHVSNIIRFVNGGEAASWAYGKSRIVGGRRFRHRETLIGHIYFWRQSPVVPSTWVKIGESTYPAFASGPYPCKPTITGGLVSGSADADGSGDNAASVFIVNACLTGDGVLNDVAFANGPRGWGLIEDVPGGLASLGHRSVITEDPDRVYPADAGWYRLAFVDSELETIQNTAYLSNAESGQFPRQTRWRWSGAKLVATSDTAFVAQPQAAPNFDAPALPGGACPKAGTYSASFAVRYHPWGRPRRVANGPLGFVVFPDAAHFPSHFECQQQLASSTSMTVLLGHAAKPYTAHVPFTHRMWMSAPLWMILIGQDGFLGPRTPVFIGHHADRSSPFVVSPSFGVNEMLARFGYALPGPKLRDRRRPTSGTVTFRDGKVVGLAVRP